MHNADFVSRITMLLHSACSAAQSECWFGNRLDADVADAAPEAAAAAADTAHAAG